MIAFRFFKQLLESPLAPDVLEFEVPDGTQVTVSRTHVPDPADPDVNIQQGPATVRIYLTATESSAARTQITTELSGGPRAR